MIQTYKKHARLKYYSGCLKKKWIRTEIKCITLITTFRVEYNVQRAVNTLSGSVDKCMLDSTNKIAGTARNIDRWREDMYQILECVRREIDLLMCSRNRTLKAQMALRIICSISTECLDRRAFRLHMDLTEDPGQIELIKVSFYSEFFSFFYFKNYLKGFGITDHSFLREKVSIIFILRSGEMSNKELNSCKTNFQK